MLVAVNVEQRFNRTRDGAVWTDAMFAYWFWLRYLDVFSGVRVIARVREVDRPEPSWQRADGPGVSFAAVPYYLGPLAYVFRAREVARAAQGAVKADEAVILRLSSQIACQIEPVLRRTGHPYGVEVVGDPHDVFAPGVIRHPFRPFFRWWFTFAQKRQCARADAAAYVTERYLQSRYPCPGYSIGVTDAALNEEAFVPAPRQKLRSDRTFTIITVASMAQMYKAPDVLLKAAAICRRRGLELRLVMVGDGVYRPKMMRLADRLGLGERAVFRGILSTREEVLAELDRADLFVLPSRTEGLPRALLEAMARALPCLATAVGGIPELLPEEDLVPPGDHRTLAAKIMEVLSDPARMAGMSARNLEKAREYREDLLSRSRIEYYRVVKERTEAWLKSARR